MRQLTKGEATSIYKSKIWRHWSNEEMVRMQLKQENSFIPERVFVSAIRTIFNVQLTNNKVDVNKLLPLYNEKFVDLTNSEAQLLVGGIIVL